MAMPNVLKEFIQHNDQVYHYTLESESNRLPAKCILCMPRSLNSNDEL